MRPASGLILLIALAVCFHPASAHGARKGMDGEYDRKWRDYMAHHAEKIPGKKYPFESCFQKAAREYSLPVSLLLAVARGESYFDPRAESSRQCYGIMQIRWPGTARHLGILNQRTLYDPCTNIRAGARYLRELMDRYHGSLHRALAAYNYGPGRIPRKGSPEKIPAGALWYSGYIYHHLESVLEPLADKTKQRPFNRRPGRKEVIVFSRPFRARGFLNYISSRAPGVRMTWFRAGTGRYQVLLLYDSEKELRDGRRKLGQLGVEMI